METHRLRAPSGDGALLASPSVAEASALLVRNSSTLSGWQHDFQGRSADRLRAMARSQALQASRRYLESHGLDVPAMPTRAEFPIVVTGHQPELYHPGVWVKNFCVARLARQQSGAGLNVIVDDDTPKSSSIRVPVELDGVLNAGRVDFDRWEGEVPHEDLPVRDESRFASFADRVRAALPRSVADPLIGEFWPRVLRFRGTTDRSGLRIALGRRAQEAAWGVHNFEVPLSALCETEAFTWFASHIMANLPKFQDVHNQALDRYREAYGIRSKNHPVPALGGKDGWLEAPFWAWRAASPRRRPLLVRQLSHTLQIRLSGEDAPLMELPLSPDREACCAVDQLMELPSMGVRLRTRALTTTMFTRLLVGDLFLHGIGGAKYDELGDEVVRGFFGVRPPDFLTLSLTLWLNLGAEPATLGRLHEVERDLRETVYNPDRHQADPGSPAVRDLIGRRLAEIERPVERPAEKLERFRNLRQINELLQPGVELERVFLIAERARLAEGVRRNQIAQSREFSFVLHPAERLRRAFELEGKGPGAA
ncbi:hypothetical protein EP7_003516 [Isosphaeraceae bacterium EP7]